MSSDQPTPLGIHLVGSIPLRDTDEVLRTVGATLGTHVRRTPDGETGVRARWNSWTAPSYEATPGLEMLDPPEGGYTPWKQARLVLDPDELVLAPLGFSDAALASYARFAELKAEGALPPHLRFQVCLPTPIAPMIILVEEGSRAGVEPALVRRLDAEVDEILHLIPHDELSIQWDVCQDVGIWEGYYPAYFDDPKQGVVDRLVRCADTIPANVEVGFHLCYGDFGHKHFMEPTDLGVAVAIANAVTAATKRDIQWFHMPVPIDRDDDPYFAPMCDLALGTDTELYLGVVHFDDGAEGARRRMATAARHAPKRFGISTECGFGRRPLETIAPLLALHVELATS